MCSLYLAHSPGLHAFAQVWQQWFAQFMDRADPAEYFDKRGWTGAGGDPSDPDLARIVSGGGRFNKKPADEAAGNTAKPKPKNKAKPKSKPKARPKPKAKAKGKSKAADKSTSKATRVVKKLAMKKA